MKCRVKQPCKWYDPNAWADHVPAFGKENPCPHLKEHALNAGCSGWADGEKHCPACRPTTAYEKTVTKTGLLKGSGRKGD